MSLPTRFKCRKLGLTNDEKLLKLIIGLIFTITMLIFTDDKTIKKVNFVRLEDGPNGSRKAYPYDKNLPIIFVNGIPRSGTTLMRSILDAHPAIRCGQETGIIPRMIRGKDKIFGNATDSGVLDEAMRSFFLEVIVRHGKSSEFYCNKDLVIGEYALYINKLFPKSKMILMIRDARATVHSILSRDIAFQQFNRKSYPDSFKLWNSKMEPMYAQCAVLGKKVCIPVYYEQLILHPEKEIRKIFDFLSIKWDDAVLSHEKYVDKEIALSKNDISTDQVIKPINLKALNKWVGKIPDEALMTIDETAPMLNKLGYDTKSLNPNYGKPDSKVEENTRLILENREYWHKLSHNYTRLADIMDKYDKKYDIFD
jgi:protein-tyrosine sulfotransferase